MEKAERSERAGPTAQIRFWTYILALLFVFLSSSTVEGGPRQGEKIPSLSAKTLDGEDVKIDFSEGTSPVILTFWSIYCKSCSEEMEKIQVLVEKYGFDRVRVYAVNEDFDLKKERVSTFLANLEKKIGKIQFTVLYDEDAKIFKLFSLIHMPTLIYIQEDGEVREIIEGFDRGRQRAVISALAKLIEEVAPEKLKEVEEEKYYEIAARVPLCGIYREGKWVRPVDDSRESQEKSLERAVSIAEYLSVREALQMALGDVGINLYVTKKEPSCLKSYGIEPELYLGKKDALDLFTETFNLREILSREEGKTREEERYLQSYSIYRANLRKLRERIIEKGYSPRASTYVLKFVNADFFNHSEFTDKLPRQLPLIGSLKTVSKDGQLVEDELSCYTGEPEKLALELQDLNLERERISATYLGGNIIEIQFLR